MSSRTSFAVAWPRFTMMFACIQEICASPWRKPLSPHWSTSRPAPTPSIFLKIEPALGCHSSHGWREPRQLRFSCMIRCMMAGSLRWSWNVGEHDIGAVMKDAVVIAEVHVIGVHRAPLPFLAQNVARLEHFRDEHRAFPLGRGRVIVQILPDGATHR